MDTKKLISPILSVVLILMVLLTGVFPVQTVAAATLNNSANDGKTNAPSSENNDPPLVPEFSRQALMAVDTDISSSGGSDTTGVFRPSNGLLYLKNQNTTGFADIAINYGNPGDYPVVGDWYGDGKATIGIYRVGKFYLRNSNSIGFADLVFAFGQVGDQPIAGDWDGDGTDTTGVFRPINGIIFLKNSNTTGFADIALNYGIPGDKPVTGDWDNDGIDTIGVYRNGQFMLRNLNTVGFADIVFGLGNPGDMPIAGNWDGLP